MSTLTAPSTAQRPRPGGALSDRTLRNVAFAAGVVMAAGIVGAAAVHLALAEYARDLQPAAAQALNSLDTDSFLLFTTGIATLVLAGSLIALRSRLLPAWLSQQQRTHRHGLHRYRPVAERDLLTQGQESEGSLASHALPRGSCSAQDGRDGA